MLRLRTLLLAVTSTLTLTTTATPVPAPVPAPVPVPVSKNGITTRDQWDFPDWKGQGQVRTRYIQNPYPDLGCLTSAGQWTTNEALCGVFETSWINNYTFYLSSVPSNGPSANSKAGACGIDVNNFRCGGGVREAVFGTFGNGGPIEGHPTLRYAQYGVMATNAQDSPPSVTQAPVAIHFYTGVEKGKWVWLAWKALDG
ncbi:uncharacterized protein B0T15DRAFT_321892 [Chaetomium strumarium]|uniref:Ecp2 effector protein domain-containing protein n=1 Tax=Chaetomium strumarium TaxID=1170767 RepID=A0AAJ0GKQ3_9PEZI|nr:hypothetical protein B0T15DRAFT_321892 [Chaetomium strumarium]